MEHIGPFMFNGIRFAIGTVSLLPLALIRRRTAGINGRYGGTAMTGLLKGGAVCGACLFLGSSFQQLGIVYTSAGNAGFVTGMYVVFVPFIGLFFGQSSGRGRWAGILLSVTGLYLLSVNEGFRMHPGDGLVLISAVFWALHMLAVGHYSPKTDPVLLSIVQFSVCAFLSLCAGLLSEDYSQAMVTNALVPLLYGGLMSVGVAYTLQVSAQRTAHPAHAAIILSLEGAFAALGGWLLIGETMTPRALFGCALMLSGVIAAQWDTILKAKPAPGT